MNIVKTFGIDTDRLAEKKISFNPKTGEFTTIVTLGFCCAFEQVVQIAKFDFLNLYIPDQWYLNKRNLFNTNFVPSENKRIIQPYLSKNKGCLVLPNVDIVSKKHDITGLILNSFECYENCINKIKKKWNYALSSCGRTPYFGGVGSLINSSVMFERVGLFVRQNGLKLGEDNDIIGKRYFAYPKFTINKREYTIVTPYDLSDSYFFRIVDGVFRQATDWKEEFWEDFTSPKNEQIETIRAIKQASTFRGGPRLSKFLFQCSMINDIQIKQRSDVFAIKTKGNTFASVQLMNIESQPADLWKYAWFIKFFNNTDEGEDVMLKLRGSDSNSEEVLNRIKEYVC